MSLQSAASPLGPKKRDQQAEISLKAKGLPYVGYANIRICINMIITRIMTIIKINVGPCLVLRSPIMCFRGRVIQDLGNDLRSPIMCFDFGALKI